MWFCEARARNIPVSGKLMQEKALLIAMEQGLDNFTPSNGWLESFNRRHNIKLAVLSGEAGDVDSSVVSDWKKRLPQLCDGYDDKDIFNADETGLYYRALSNRSMVTNQESYIYTLIYSMYKFSLHNTIKDLKQPFVPTHIWIPRTLHILDFL